MIPDNKVSDLAQRLLEKSREGRVTWQHIPHGMRPTTCRVSMPEAVIELERVPTPDEDAVRLRVRRDDGLTVGVVASDDLNTDPETRDILSALYTEAERRVTRWDEVLANVEKRLSTPGVIGTAEEKIPF
jgi:hypothetical protein